MADEFKENKIKELLKNNYLLAEELAKASVKKKMSEKEFDNVCEEVKSWKSWKRAKWFIFILGIILFADTWVALPLIIVVFVIVFVAWKKKKKLIKRLSDLI